MKKTNGHWQSIPETSKEGSLCPVKNKICGVCRYNNSKCNSEIAICSDCTSRGYKCSCQTESKPSFNSATCDSCRRINIVCVGGRICERCQLHGFDCMFTAGDATADLKRELSSLLLPGTPSPRSYQIEVGSGLDDEESMKSAPPEKVQNQPNLFEERRESENEEAILPVQPIDQEEINKRLKELWLAKTPGIPRHVSGKSPRTKRSCDACRGVKVKCDRSKASCSRCQQKGVECRYQLPTSSLSFLDFDKGLPNQSSHPIYGSKILHQPTYHPNPPFKPVTLHTTQYHSVPTGCISCFESKSKCIATTQNTPCTRCTSQSIECKTFPHGTRLRPCDSCTGMNKVCTNEQRGLCCDGCVELGVECSRSILVFGKREKGGRGLGSCDGHIETKGKLSCADSEKKGVDSWSREQGLEFIEGKSIPVLMSEESKEAAVEERNSVLEIQISSDWGSNPEDWYLVTHNEAEAEISEERQVLIL